MFLFANLFLSSFLVYANGQLATLLFEAEKDDCKAWSEYGADERSCVWLKGPSAEKKHPWNQGYFEQLPPKCRQTTFFKTAKTLMKDPIDNALKYLRLITKDESPCGMCSYQQSCGTGCTGSKTVLERRCPYLKQNHTCTVNPAHYMKPTNDPWVPENCKVWPSEHVKMPATFKPIVDSLDLLRCSKGTDAETGEKTCRCCCYPFKPDETGKSCVYAE